MRPLAIDLFCGAGGASMGLYRAGFGDYAGPDITSSRFYRWARQAGIFLVCVVMNLAPLAAYGATVAVPLRVEAEIGVARSSKDITVIDGPKSIYSQVPEWISGSTPIVIANNNSIQIGSIKGMLFWPKYSNAWGVSLFYLEHAIWRRRVYSNPSCCVNYHAICGGLAGIFYSNLKCNPIGLVIYSSNASSVYGHISPQLPLGMFTAIAGQLTRSEEQSDGGGRQKYSEHRQDARENDEPPFGRRMLLAVCSILSCLGLSIVGWKRFYDQRRVSGAALIGAGCVIGLSGVGLFWSTGFRSTWGWWI